MVFDDPRHNRGKIIKDKIRYIYGFLEFTLPYWPKSSHARLIQFDLSTEMEAYGRRLFQTLEPMSLVGAGKTRIGDKGDGGYVVPDIDYRKTKTQDKIAYSFGVAGNAPWDMQMAKWGWDVFQYDGTIDVPPELHPRLHFYRLNISGLENPPPDQINVSQIIKKHGHEGKSIILQCDIEGSEWEMLKSMSEENLLQFEQIILEIHWFYFDKELDSKIAILEKLNKTHQCIHLHANNLGPVIFVKKFRMIPWSLEVTYVRRKDWKFKPCYETFPGRLDYPNTGLYPDIFIGRFHHRLAFLDPMKARTKQTLLSCAKKLIPWRNVRRRLHYWYSRFLCSGKLANLI